MSSLETTINDRPVTVEYTFSPGYVPRWTADREPEEPDEAEIRAITTSDGYNIFNWVGDSDIERIEREIIKHERENGRAAA